MLLKANFWTDIIKTKVTPMKMRKTNVLSCR